MLKVHISISVLQPIKKKNPNKYSIIVIEFLEHAKDIIKIIIRVAKRL